MSDLLLQVLTTSNVILSSFNFYPGEDLTMILQIIEDDTQQNWVIPSFPVPQLSLIVPGYPQNVQIKSPTIVINSFNPSILYVPISAAISATMSSGNASLTIVSAALTGNAVLTPYTTAEGAQIVVNNVAYPFNANGGSAGEASIALTSAFGRGALGVVSNTIGSPTPLNVIVNEAVNDGSGNLLMNLQTYNTQTRIAQGTNLMNMLTANPIIS